MYLHREKVRIFYCYSSKEFPQKEDNIKNTYRGQMNHSAPPLTLRLQQRCKDLDLIQLARPKHLIPFDN